MNQTELDLEEDRGWVTSKGLRKALRSTTKLLADLFCPIPAVLSSVPGCVGWLKTLQRHRWECSPSSLDSWLHSHGRLDNFQALEVDLIITPFTLMGRLDLSKQVKC